MDILFGLSVPFLGGVCGAAFVFFVKGELKSVIQRLLLGFAAGVMTFVCICFLTIPALKYFTRSGVFSFFPVLKGFVPGVVIVFAFDKFIPHLHLNTQRSEGPHTKLHNTALLILAALLHNLPEGLAIGTVCAELSAGLRKIPVPGNIAIIVGLGVQNLPESILLSLSLKNEGNGKIRSFLYGTVTAAEELAVAVATIRLSVFAVSYIPYLFSAAAGGMLYIVVEELIPEASQRPHSDAGALSFTSGFVLMMILGSIL